MNNTSSYQNLSQSGKVLATTGLAAALLFLFLSPFAYMIFTSLKTQDQISEIGAPVWPAKAAAYEYNGEEVEGFVVPLNTCAGSENDNSEANLGIVQKGLRESTFMDPNNPGRGEFVCQVSWRALERPWQFAPEWANYVEVWNTINIPRVLGWTLFYAITTMIGTVVSCILVAYGFSRFNFPGREFLFVILISTIFLPAFVTVIPTYTFFQKIGWVGTWLPLIVPHYFANAYNVFLFRQYFMTMPKALDEAAAIDGAGPMRILWSIIVPQSYPVILAVVVFHIVFAWNDYFSPLIYLSTKPDWHPISVALSRFNGIYGSRPELIQGGSLIALIAPLLLFIFAQRFFIQGIVITGVDK